MVKLKEKLRGLFFKYGTFSRKSKISGGYALYDTIYLQKANAHFKINS